ncbi:hypothetical protein Hanom_Chr14g01287911 [Helianthus anomalus]
MANRRLVLRSHSPSGRFHTSPSSNSFASSNRSISVTQMNNNSPAKKPLQAPKRMCMCSPTSHPGSFRCSLHKNINNLHNNTASYPNIRLNKRQSAMTNSLVRIGTVEGGDLVKRALAALIRPSSHQQRRHTVFQPRPSRLSVMSNAD